tara:strand:- start:554 stop:1495 length:942 start_codon:yes stop_codon:yes gene_type:complete
MVQLKKMVDHSRLTVKVESIDKQLAEKYLEKNFKSNRLLKRRTLDSLVHDMKNDNFHIGWDCIAFNEQGELVNGQHRLNAIIKSDKSCDFLVVRNVRHDTISHFDQGNRRSQADRITVAGTRVHPKACACIRLALRSYDCKDDTNVVYSEERYDNLIKYYYTKHSDFFNTLENDGYLQFKYKNNYLIAAFKIFSEMQVGRSAGIYYDHGMSAYERAIHWLDLSNGSATNGRTIDQNYDQAMWKLKDVLLSRKVKGYATYGIQVHRIFVCAATYFMRGKNNNVTAYNLSTDPFTPFKELKPTNIKTFENRGFNQ